MATLVNVSHAGIIQSSNAASEATLSASDTFTYVPGTGQRLRLRNVTAGALTVTITGSAAASKTYLPDGGTVNYAAGYSTGSIAATTGDVTLDLDKMASYLQGVITMTGGSGIKALLSSNV